MFLSRIAVKPSIAAESQLGLLLKGNSYGMHRLLWDLFDQEERFIFREESTRDQLACSRNLPIYYVMSSNKPAQDSVVFSIDSKLFQPAVTAGEKLAFRLRANPTITRSVPGKSRSSRHDVIMDAQRQWLINACKERGIKSTVKKGDLRRALENHEDFSGTNKYKIKQEIERNSTLAANEWLDSRSRKNGFSINLGEIQATGYRWHALPEKGRNAGFSSLEYEGVLTVEDTLAFHKCLRSGLGPSKAFGCGLLMVRRFRY